MANVNQDAKRGTVDLAILATLEHDERYGLEILDEVQRQTGGALTFKEGSLYPALHRLVKQRWVTTRWQESSAGGSPRKYYALTEDGRAALARKRDEWRQVRDAMEAFLSSLAASIATPRPAPTRVLSDASTGGEQR